MPSGAVTPRPSVQLPRPASTSSLPESLRAGHADAQARPERDLTGAQCMKGMVYQNHMINVGPTNAKIFDRCVRLSRFAVDHDAAPQLGDLKDVDAERVRGRRVVDIKPEILSARVVVRPRSREHSLTTSSSSAAEARRTTGVRARQSVLPLAIVLAAKGVLYMPGGCPDARESAGEGGSEEATRE